MTARSFMQFGRTVRWRLTFWYTLVLTFSFILFGFVVDHLVRQNLYNQVDRQLTDTLAVATGALGRTFTEERNPTEARLRDEIGELGLSSQLALQITFQGKRLLVNVQSLPAAVADFGRRGSPAGIPVTLEIEESPHHWRICLGRGGNGVNEYHVLLARDLTLVEAQRNEFQRTLLIAIPLILLFAAGSGYFLAGRALNPVGRIARHARQVQAGALNQRLEIENMHDEFGQLAQVLNDLFSRLESAFQQQRHFLSDAAHELRTPAAILRSQADVALAQQRSADEYAAALAAMRTETEHLSAIVDDLLLIARMDTAQLPDLREPADLAEIVDESCRALKPLIDARGLTLNWEIGEEVPVTGDSRLLRRAAMNLLTNAIKFTPAAGAIDIAVTFKAGAACLEIADTGGGVDEADLPHIFERFYRGSRQPGSDSEGAGLGLSIVKMIAELHGGKVAAASRPGSGAVFAFLIPSVAGKAERNCSQIETKTGVLRK